VKRAIVVGSSGYAGRELCALLESHPELELSHAMSARDQDDPEWVPTNGQTALQPGQFGAADVVFLCTPHGKSANLARQALDAGCAVVDLSADLRLNDAEDYAQIYGLPHPAPELLPQATYGLTEHARFALPHTRLVANPGCYPTSILLPLLPLLQANLLEPSAAVVADSKSGVSGAGKAPSAATHFGNVHDNFRAYNVGTHRHAPEIEQQAGIGNLVFVAHLLPCLRGILSTLYLTPRAGHSLQDSAEQFQACLQDAYGEEPFVRVLEQGTPALRDVVHTNRCHMAVHAAGPVVVITSALDNLLKGAAGQALQNANLMLGLEETLGLPAGPSMAAATGVTA